MIDHIVVDVEIQKTIEELPHGWDDTHLMGVSCACVWEYQGQRMRIYGPDDVGALQERLLKADRISGYNIWAFDFPVIWGFSKDEWKMSNLGPRHFAAEEWERLGNLKKQLFPKTNDLLRRIWHDGLHLDPDHFTKETHGNWGLDVVTKGTFGGPGKIGYGGDAPKWFQAGQWARVVNYCADDVALERDLTDFIDQYGYVINGKTGQVVHLRRI